jgi:1-acyl-sn-glycerol-3-phosphate acyltransferase
VTAAETPLPRRVGWLLTGFRWYVRRFLRKNFHAVRLSLGGADIPADGEPLLIVMNHPSWWDPMLGAFLLDLFPKHDHYCAIDAEMIEKYGVFKKLGFFGIDMKSLRGAAQFLKTGSAILSAPGRAVWVTAQGEFADVRQRPLNLKPGVGHLAARMTGGWVLPLAFEYAFWNERPPEALVRIGEPVPISPAPAKAWTARIEAALTRTLDALNGDAISRAPARFRTLLGGKTGAGGAYDFFRRLGCWLRFKRFDPTHDAAKAVK